MTGEIYFFDSYTIIEIIKGNENYSKYLNSVILLTKLNLFEVFYSVLKEYDEEKADLYLDKYYKFIIDYDKEIIKEASKFRLQYKKRNLSMTDCIGYIIARTWKVKFLTGDKEFEDLDNVKFVK